MAIASLMTSDGADPWKGYFIEYFGWIQKSDLRKTKVSIDALIQVFDYMDDRIYILASSLLRLMKFIVS